MHPVHIIDLHFLGLSKVIGVYVIPHRQGVVLVESGPGSTFTNLEKGLKTFGFSLKAVTDVFLTHIHLDHAGASGLLAREGARIHVHPKGAGHMADPSRLLASAERVYGDQMEDLWGEFPPVAKERLHTVSNHEQIKVNDLTITALYTPGHAEHHLAFVFEDICFSGDIGGIRFPGSSILRLPTPPPDFHLQKWRKSIGRLKETGCQRIVPTHFGLYPDIDRQLDEVERQLDELEAGMASLVTPDTSPGEVNAWLVDWLHKREKGTGAESESETNHETLNPTMNSAMGIHRYWNKYRVSPPK